MTFTEAAVEVLRLVGKPLHYKRITELAIERNLLSHVGKTPEVTMSSRLATMVKRDRGDAPIVKVKPGVFGLREFDGEQLVEAPNASTEVAAGGTDEGTASEGQTGDDTEVSTEESAAATPVVAKPPSRPLPGSDVFPEEDDDDEPIFGTPATAAGGDDAEDDGEGDGDGRSKRRRRRRKRGRGEDGEEAGASSSARESGRDRDRDAGRRRGRDRNDRDRGRDEPTGDWNREHGDGDLVGKDLADSVVSVLQVAGRSGMSAMRIAERLVRKGRLAGDPTGLVPTISAAVRADLARSQSEGQRPRFRHEGASIVLVEALLPQDLVRAEQDVLRAAERQRDRARRAFLRRLGDLPFAGLAELLATWLNAEGVVSLRAVRRPGTSGGELHMAGTFRRGTEETRLAIVFYRDGRDLGRERVIEVRGALHHYGNASAAWVVTMGQVLSGAREEATAPGTPPIAVFDGGAMAAAMERVGVGLTRHSALLTGLDFELLDALGGGDGGRGRDASRRGRPERQERSERSERSDRSQRSDRSERSEDRDDEERPRRRRERGRGAEREAADAAKHGAADAAKHGAADAAKHGAADAAKHGAADAAKGTAAADSSSEDADADNDAFEGGDGGEASEGGRRRRRRRRRGRDRGDAATAESAEASEDTSDADVGEASAQRAEASAGDGEGDDSDAAAAPDRSREDSGAGDSDDDERDDEYDADDDDDEARDQRAYDDEDDDDADDEDEDDDDDEDDDEDDDDDDEDEPRRSSRWSNSESDEEDDDDGEDRPQHRDDEDRS